MAISASTEWEVRPGAGSDSNSGGFVAGASGVDYSQQNAAQYGFTDLVLVTTTTCSSASHTFDADDVGNLIYISAGTNFTVGRYQIVSVAAGVATLDRVAGTAGATGGTYAVGGALATISTAVANYVGGNHVYIKATGTITYTSAITIAAITTGTFVTFEGYTTTRGDNGRVTITTSTNSVAFMTLNANISGFIFKNLNASNTAATRARFVQATSGTHTGVHFYNCILDGFSEAIQFVAAPGFAMFNCEVKNCTGDGITIGTVNANNSALLSECWFHDNGGDGAQIAGGNGVCVVRKCAFEGNTGDGLRLVDSTGTSGNKIVILDGCCFVGNGSDGVEVVNNTIGLASKNCIYWNNTGESINYVSGGQAFKLARTNGYDSAPVNFPADDDDVTITADPFTDFANGDYSLNSTSGGGADLKTVGSPSSIPFDI